MSGRVLSAAAWTLVSLLLNAGAASAQSAPAASAKPAGTAAPAGAHGPAVAKPSDSYDELFQRYLLEAHRSSPATSQYMWMSGLTLDRRARNVNDLITIRVVENIVGSGTADSQLAKESEAGVGVTSFFGVEKKLPGSVNPSSLVGAGTKTDFKGGGSTNRAGTLTAQMTARVADVLPNGDLVVEGVREIEINGDRQMVVLSGVVRTADVPPSNVVLSTSIGQLRIRYFGNGLIKDNLQPGWLVRILNKVF